MENKIDIEFLRRSMMILATEIADCYPTDHNLRVLTNAMLSELGVRTPYPPIEDAA